MMRQLPWHMASLFGVCLCTQAALGQWISFTDDTAGRLSLSSVTINDGQEKDLVVGDFDQDGWDDIVVVRKEPFSNAGPRTDLLLMNESGVLTDRSATLAPEFLSSPSDSRDVIAADFTGDGWLDLVFANTFDEQPSFYRNLGEDVGGVWQGFVNESAARLPVLTPLNQPNGPQFCAVWAGDVDGQNGIDIYFANYRNQITSDVLLMNDGTGNFTDETAARMGNNANVAFGTSVEMHDLDDDGDLDIIKTSTLFPVAPFNDLGTFILYNNGSGVFNTIPFTKIDGDQPYMFTVGPLNADNMLDFYLVDDFDDLSVFINANPVDGPISTISSTVGSARTERFGGNVKLADLDLDGDLDVGVAPIDVDIQNCGTDVEFALLRNPGDGLMEDPWSSANTQNFHIEAHDFAFIDIDKDGCLDIFMALCSGWRVLMRDNCVPPEPPDVIISLPNGVPNVLQPGVPVPFDVQLIDGEESVTGGTLHYSYDGGAFQTVPLQPQARGAGMYTATLPPAECLQNPRFYLSADGDLGGTEFNPPDAPIGFYNAVAGILNTVRNDEMEGPADDGWSVDLENTDDATTGVWERGNPDATDAQPENDNSPTGTLCWYTGQSAPGATNGANDVDGGSTTLFSPVFDLTTAETATIRYWRWYSNDEGPSPDADVFVVEINNGVSGWVEVETVGPTSPGEAWLVHDFDPESIVAITDTMQMRFIASDLNSGSIVEAAIDDFNVTIVECDDTPICPADIVGGNNTVDVFDLLELLNNWGTSGTGADIAAPTNTVDVFDLLDLLAAWGACT